MRINIHAGHNPDGKVAGGAIGLLKESTEARKVKNQVIKLLKANGQKVYDCTCDDGISQSDVLGKIIKKCNAHVVDLDVSIHFNVGRNDSKGDGDIAGVEVCIYSNTSKSKPYAKAVCKQVAKLGYGNRGVKVRNQLYYLKNTDAPAMLIECCFIDDKDDVMIYNYKKMAQAIVNGIMLK